MSKHQIKIVFGETATRLHLDGEPDSVVEEEGSIQTFSFDNDPEMDAFLRGVEAMNGFLDWCEYQMEETDPDAELVTRSAPRWAWEIIDETLAIDAISNAFDAGLRADIQAAITGMATACENADDEPVTRAEIDAVIAGEDND